MKKLIKFSILLLIINTTYGQDTIRVEMPYVDSENNIFLTLHWQKKPSEEEFKLLQEKSDSYEIKEEESDHIRKGLPTSIGLKYFDQNVNEHILVLNRTNNIVGKAKFKSFEFFGNNLEAGFHAYYQFFDAGEHNSKEVYSLSIKSEKYLDNTIEVFECSRSNSEIKQNYVDRELLTEDNICYSISGTKVQLEIFSFYSESAIEGYGIYKTFLIQKTDEREQILLELKDYYTLRKVFVIPILKNNHPILLFEIGIPYSDYIDSICATYENGYKLNESKMIINNRP